MGFTCNIAIENSIAMFKVLPFGLIGLSLLCNAGG